MTFLEKYKIPLLLALIKFILPFLLQHPHYELHRDEFLYLEQGNHLSWGFLEVPPMLAFLAKLTHALGGGFYVVKFWPAFIGALTLFFTCAMAMEMGGGKKAQWIAGLSMIASAYLRVHFLFQPNFLEIFFWTISAYFLVRYIISKNIVFIYYLCLALACSFYSKYSVVFFTAGIFIGLLFTPYRNLFDNKHLYLAALLALLIIIPNIIWQYNHNWPVIHHMNELRETQLQYISPADFLKNQVLLFLPCFFVFIGGIFWLLQKAGIPFRILVWIYFTVVVLLIASNGKDYYALGAYPMLLAAGSVWLQQVFVKRAWLQYVTFSYILIVFAVIIPMGLPVFKPGKLAAYYRTTGINKSGLLKWEDLEEHPLPQDFADMISWKELGDKVSKAYHSLPDTTKTSTLIYARNYALAGAIKYYSKDLPHVYSDNASFLLWMPDKFPQKHILFIGRFKPKPGDVVFEQFEKHTILDSIINPLAREYGTKIILFENGSEQLSPMIEAGIKEMKSRFTR